jgi:hypothetical protein
MSSSSNQMVLDVQLPPGAKPHDKINVTTPDGRTIEIIVPPGCVGGQRINVVVDNNVTSNSSNSVDAVQHTDVRSNRAAVGIAAAAAVTGLILIGPITGIAVAGAALYATTREDSIGDAARQGGVAACNAYDFGMVKAKEHNVYERLKDAGAATYKKAVEVNNELKITEKASATVRDLNNEHHIAERITAAGVDVVSRTPGAMSALFKMAAAASSPSIKK